MIPVGLRIDVDTFRGTRLGVPALVETLAKHGVSATFFMTVGPDNMGRHLWRLLKPQFLLKMLRSNAANLYGWDILLRGTFWPGTVIGDRLADVIRLPQTAGHEMGLHAWDHHGWQVGIDRYSESAMRRQLRAGFDKLADILGAAPTCSAAAGWRCNQQALLLKEEFQFRFNSDCRGSSLFRPAAEHRVLAPQVPVTLPTFDEIIGSNGIDVDNFNAHVLDQCKPGQLNVYTIHAEVEGIAFHSQFEQLLIEAHRRGIVFQPLGELLRQSPVESLPVDAVIKRTLPGREGWLAWQGVGAGRGPRAHEVTAYIALAISIILTVVSQTLQKKVAVDHARAIADNNTVDSTLGFYLHSVAFWLALATLGGAMLSWLLVLSSMEVSRAYSLLSINYVLMLLVSRYVFNERIPTNRWFAVLVLLGGIWLIVSS